jgi:hypothetical protein
MTSDGCKKCGSYHASGVVGTSHGGVVRIAAECADCGHISRYVYGPQIVARCRCGAQYSVVQWDNLTRLGLQEGGDGNYYELRKCVCGSVVTSRVTYEVP